MEPEQIGVSEAKTRLSELLDKVSKGRTYRITKRGRVVAELRSVNNVEGRPVFGADRGRIRMSDDFDAPLPDLRGYS